MTANTFNLKTCPLTGSHLLEAGAGTGKTYSLAFLYLRLLLEKGLRVDEILVTTFTIAATAELKARIFETIAATERVLLALSESSAERPAAEIQQADAFVLELLQGLRGDYSDTLLQQRLRLALSQFDSAQVFTINGFALQLLRENNDVLGCYLPEVIVDDDSDYVKQAYLALARDNFSALGDEALAVGQAVASYASEDLFRLLASMLHYHDYLQRANAALFARAEQVADLRQQALDSDHDGAVTLIAAAIADKKLNAITYKLAKLEEYRALLDDAAAYADAKLVAFFSRELLYKKLKKGQLATFEHPFFHLCEQLLPHTEALALLDKLPTYRALLALVAVLQTRVDDLKAEHMALTHDDVVARAAAGAAAIRTPLKAALIDEAQDTNSQQMALFRALFLERDGQGEQATVFFVGDPKQAIYGFRGANVFSYLDIEQAVQYHHIMDTNYRSTEALNTSINAFFAAPDSFLTAGKIRYHPIGWHCPNEDSGFGEQSLSVITAPAAGKDALAQAAAEALSTLLAQSLSLTEKNSTGAETARPLAPHDVAVLVRERSQAIAIKQALAEKGLASSFTGTLSLYETDEALLLLALLNAVNGGSSRLVKSLMLTPVFGYSLEAVGDTQTVITLSARLHDFAKVYTQSGFSVMFYRLLNAFGIAGRLLQSEDGKRRLTNFIQLFERLQQRLQRQSLSLSGLCEQLAQAIRAADSEAELRLEDDSAITIMTMHAAKGLEFPVVCLPFFDYDASRAQRQGLLISHQHRLACPAFLPAKDLRQWVEEETLAEQRRLAYVALTRAKYHNLIIRQPEGSRFQKSAMLTALLGDTPERIMQAPFARHVSVEDVTAPAGCSAPPTYTPKVLQKPLYSAWQLESFSRLQQASADRQAIEALPAENGNTANAPTDVENTAVDETAQPLIDTALMRYPAGARPGTALHEMYEHFLQHRTNDEAFHRAIANSLDKHLFAEDKTALPELTALADAVAETTAIALAPRDFCLQDVDRAKQSIEMKFFLHLSPVARQRLLTLFQQPADAALPSQVRHLVPTEGYLHGYIDYLFEHQGKYYVLDYKSNRLGEHFADFERAGMQAEMQHHRYDLQALIYTLALCKHLRIDNEGDYHAKIGGYYYLFVRGMARGQSTGIYADKVPWALLAELL